MKKEPWDLIIGIIILYGVNISSIETSKNTAVLEKSEIGVSQYCYFHWKSKLWLQYFYFQFKSKFTKKGIVSEIKNDLFLFSPGSAWPWRHLPQSSGRAPPSQSWSTWTFIKILPSNTMRSLELEQKVQARSTGKTSGASKTWAKISTKRRSISWKKPMGS